MTRVLGARCTTSPAAASSSLLRHRRGPFLALNTVPWSPRCAEFACRCWCTVAVALLGLLRHYWSVGHAAPPPPTAPLRLTGRPSLGSSATPCGQPDHHLRRAMGRSATGRRRTGLLTPTPRKVALDPAIRWGRVRDLAHGDYLLMYCDLRQYFMADTGNVIGQALATPASSGAGNDGETIELWVNRPGPTVLGESAVHIAGASSATRALVAGRHRGLGRRAYASCAPSGPMTGRASTAPGAGRGRTCSTPRGCSPGSGRTAPWWTSGRTRTRTPPRPADGRPALGGPALVEAGQRMVQAIWAHG